MTYETPTEARRQLASWISDSIKFTARDDNAGTSHGYRIGYCGRSWSILGYDRRGAVDVFLRLGEADSGRMLTGAEVQALYLAGKVDPSTTIAALTR